MTALELTTTTFVIKSVDLRHYLDEDGKPWFIAKDVCDYLEIANPADAYNRVWPEYKGVSNADTPGGVQSMITVNEAGLYQLIFTSRKPEAVAFQRWVFETLLPTLRQQGYFKLAGRVVPVERSGRGGWGRQPFLDVIKSRGFSQRVALETMNALPLDGVALVKATSYGNQIYGGARVNDALAKRASAWLNLPPTELFTSWRG